MNKLNRLRSKAEGLLREYEALIVVGNMVTASRRKDLESERGELRKRPTIGRMTDLIARKTEEISALRRNLGVAASNEELIRYLKFAEGVPKGKELLVPFYCIRKLFTGGQGAFEQFKDIPDHARIVLHWTKPPYHAEETTIDWVCAEVLLYEDMCALFNLAKEYRGQVQGRVDKRKAGKLSDALLRAAECTALYFVESYLNGLAFDFFLASEGRLDNKAQKDLTEWDVAKNRPFRLGLREKLLQYPRIILGGQHPPLQESNCPELAYVVDRGKSMRDSVVHASSRPNPGTFEPEKESILFNPDFQELERLIDSAITLVRKIESTVHGHDKRLFWLCDRGTDGFFPSKVFR